MVDKLLAIQHRLNPLHVYCRFLDRGLNRRLSTAICKSYERVIFFWFSRLIKSAIYCYALMDRSYSFKKEIAGKR